MAELSSVKKTYISLGDHPVLSRTLSVFDRLQSIGQIIVIVSSEDVEKCWSEVITPYQFQTPIQVVAGGSTRQKSVFCGLQVMDKDVDWVVVHDAVRPFVTGSQIENCLNQCKIFQAVALAVPVKDTIKIVDEDQFVVQTPERQSLWAVQTPQVFNKKLLIDAHYSALDNVESATDDSTLVEQNGTPVKLIEGDYRNLKITTPEDLEVAQTFLSNSNTEQDPVYQNSKLAHRIGIGYDLHRLVKDRKLVLGGVEIPFDLGLLGHSDADVLTHAICDSILGAAALGDIGQHFPDNDPQYEGIDSLVLLKRVCELILNQGHFAVENIDATVICQRPKLATYIPYMRQKLAKVIGIEIFQINIKATTAEGLGDIGQSQAIAAQSVCCLISSPPSN